MVERQPEKLNVVGSSPILDKMLYLLFLILLFCNNLIKMYFYVYILYICLFFYTFFKLFFKNTFYKTSTSTYLLLNVLLRKLKLTFIFSGRVLSKFSKVSFIRCYRVKWKPLFKKSSYFGIYRSSKNQFLNK